MSELLIGYVSILIPMYHYVYVVELKRNAAFYDLNLFFMQILRPHLEEIKQEMHDRV